MCSEIASALKLHSPENDKKFIFATKALASDLSFLNADILSHYVKNNYSIVVVNLAQSYNHYSHLLLKSGINIKLLRNQQRVSFVDVTRDAGNMFSASVKSEKNDLLSDFISNISDKHSLNPLFGSIRTAVQKICDSQPYGVVLFIDEISVLLNLGASLQAVQSFVQQCYSLCACHVTVPSKLLIGSFHDECDWENRKLVNYLLHLADIKIEVECLKTGYSKETHGKITMEVKNKAECTSTYQKLFFKVGDKGAKLLTLGL